MRRKSHDEHGWLIIEEADREEGPWKVVHRHPSHRVNALRADLFATTARLEKFDEPEMLERRDALVVLLDQAGDDGKATCEKFARIHSGAERTATKVKKRRKKHA